LLTIGGWLVLAACGTDTPTAPPTSTPAAVVTITAQINTNSVSGIQAFGEVGDPVESLQLDATYTVTVNGQTVQVQADGSFRVPNVSAPARTFPIFPQSTIEPGSNRTGVIAVPFELPAGVRQDGIFTITVTGTDSQGGEVLVSADFPVAAQATHLPPGTCTPSAQVACLLNGRFHVELTKWSDFFGNVGQGSVNESFRFDNGAWYFFDGATDAHPNNFDVYVEMADQCNASGQFGFAMNATPASGTTTEGFEITVIDLSTNLRRTVTNPQGEPADPLDVPDFFACP